MYDKCLMKAMCKPMQYTPVKCLTVVLFANFCYRKLYDFCTRSLH